MDASSIPQESPFNSQVSIYTFAISTLALDAQWKFFGCSSNSPVMIRGCVLNSPNIPLQFTYINLYFQNFYIHVNPYYTPHYLKEQARSAVIWAWRFFFLFFSYCLRCSFNALHEWASNEHPTYTPPLLTHHYLAVPHSHKWIIIQWQDGPIQDENNQTTDRNCASFRGEFSTPEY